MVKFPNRITIAMTDDMFEKIKKHMNMRYLLGSISKNVETDVLLLHIIAAIENQESNPIFLRSIEEAEQNK